MIPWALKDWVEWNEPDAEKTARDRLKELVSQNTKVREALTLLAALNQVRHFGAVVAVMNGKLKEHTYLMALQELDSEFETLLKEGKKDASRQ
ncbi:MAG: hypothetical protein WC891_08810 [Actinomycetota bacterium]